MVAIFHFITHSAPGTGLFLSLILYLLFILNVRDTTQHTFERSCGHSKVCCDVVRTFLNVIGRYPDQNRYQLAGNIFHRWENKLLISTVFFRISKIFGIYHSERSFVFHSIMNWMVISETAADVSSIKTICSFITEL